jgi:catechol 2,3-dioxygenase-like lactoylglutathione lyase family enzyme
MGSPTDLKSITPILFVTDVPTSAAYFRDKLGFAIDFLHGQPPFYGAVSRDGVCVHFRCVRQPNFAELAAQEHSLILASIEVTDVHEFFAELQGRGADIVQPPTKQNWGGTDLYVRDPDGNVISFVTFGL